METKIILQSTEEFFKRGREIARLADQGKPIPESHIISFEAPEDYAKYIAANKPTE